MRNLKELLELEVVKNGVNSNLISDKELTVRVLNYVSDKIKNNNICEDISEVGLDYTFESSLYIGENTKQYLLDIRMFDNEDGNMLNAYLEIFNEDLTVHQEYVDDVWVYDDWEVM